MQSLTPHPEGEPGFARQPDTRAVPLPFASQAGGYRVNQHCSERLRAAPACQKVRTAMLQGIEPTRSGGSEHPLPNGPRLRTGSQERFKPAIVGSACVVPLKSHPFRCRVRFCLMLASKNANFQGADFLEDFLFVL